MRLVAKALIWIPENKDIKPARIYECGTCHQTIITSEGQEPMAAAKFSKGEQPEHRHMIVRRDLFLKLSTAGLCRCLEQAGDDPYCPVHGRGTQEQPTH